MTNKNDELIKEMKKYALDYNVPIMTDDGIAFLKDYIKKNKVKTILEIGTAIAYSSIEMALVDEDITITTIERDEERYKEAVKNVDKASLNDRINLIFKDALDVELTDCFDLIFIDAAKAQNIKFFTKYSANLNEGGTIITDNMNFHGLVDVDETTLSRNLRQLTRKIKKYKEFLEENSEYNTQFLTTGDGIAISKKN